MREKDDVTMEIVLNSMGLGAALLYLIFEALGL
jgi:hypothetical protein